VIVVDASVIVEALVDKGVSGTTARERLRSIDAVAPNHLPLEVISAIRRHLQAGRLSAEHGAGALTMLRQLRISLMTTEPLLERIWELRHNVTAYDAAYIALAEGLGAPFLTGDRRLATVAARSCTVEVHE
jgi:predicted nucleic acid-binding protein